MRRFIFLANDGGMTGWRIELDDEHMLIVVPISEAKAFFDGMAAPGQLVGADRRLHAQMRALLTAECPSLLPLVGDS